MPKKRKPPAQALPVEDEPRRETSAKGMLAPPRRPPPTAVGTAPPPAPLPAPLAREFRSSETLPWVARVNEVLDTLDVAADRIRKAVDKLLPPADAQPKT